MGKISFALVPVLPHLAFSSRREALAENFEDGFSPLFSFILGHEQIHHVLHQTVNAHVVLELDEQGHLDEYLETL